MPDYPPIQFERNAVAAPTQHSFKVGDRVRVLDSAECRCPSCGAAVHDGKTKPVAGRTGTIIGWHDPDVPARHNLCEWLGTLPGHELKVDIDGAKVPFICLDIHEVEHYAG